MKRASKTWENEVMISVGGAAFGDRAKLPVVRELQAASANMQQVPSGHL